MSDWLNESAGSSQTALVEEFRWLHGSGIFGGGARLGACRS